MSIYTYMYMPNVVTPDNIYAFKKMHANYINTLNNWWYRFYWLQCWS